MKNILITGACGYLGSLLTQELAKEKEILGIHHLIAADIKHPQVLEEGVSFEYLDVREKKAFDLLQKYQINCVIHLASIVTPSGQSNRAFEYSVDVEGTHNILNACIQAKVKRLIISSSGAAYGYYPENIKPLIETDPIRGNYEFAYSYHKRLIEEELKKYRELYPDLEQTIFRITTILGEKVNNQITDLFKKKIQLGICGTESGFSFIWDQDAIACFKQSIFSEKYGIYNLAGDGYVSLKERGYILKKPIIQIPAKLIEWALYILKFFKLTQYGPEQTMFLKYRPILDNKKLKDEFGFIPTKTSREVFEYYSSLI